MGLMIFQKKNKYILGIDLGTYNSTAAVVEIDSNGKASEPKIIRSSRQADKDEFGDDFEKVKSFPSFVSYRPDGSVDKVGLEAKKYFTKDLFSWDEILSNDNRRFIEFLNHNFGIDWAKKAKIEKFDDGNTIRLSNGKNFLSLKLNEEKDNVSIKIDDGRLDEFIVKTENGKLKIYKDPQYVVWGVKRLLGKTYAEAKDQGELDRFSYTIEPDIETGKCLIIVGVRKCKPEDVSGEIIKEIKKETEKEMNVSFNDVIISIPAYFDAIHATPIVQTAKLAGFKSVKTIPEPVAASIAYSVPINLKPLRLLAFDLGAGTLDVTVGNLIRKGPNPSDVTFQIKTTTGNTHLGGIDMDDRVKRLLREKSGLLSANLSSMDDVKIRREAEKAKIHLSKKPITAVAFEANNSKYSFDVDRFELEMALMGNKVEMDIIYECRKQVKEAIMGASLTPEDIEQILLIGGPSCMPSILQMLKEVFHKNPKVLSQLEQIESGKLPVDPMEAVAKGAALSSETRKSIPHPYGYGFIDLKFEPKHIFEVPHVLIPRGSIYPCMSKPYRIKWYRKAATTEIEIIQQVPETEKPEYRHLGFVSKTIKELGKSSIEITMGLNDNGELVITLNDTLDGKKVEYIGISHFRRLPIELPRDREKPSDIEQKLLHDEKDVDEAVLEELINWARAISKLCHANMEECDIIIANDIRRFLNKLDDTFDFHVWNKKEKGKYDLKSAKEHWNDILDGTNQLLHRAAELGIIEKKETAERERQGKDIENRLLKEKKKGA